MYLKTRLIMTLLVLGGLLFLASPVAAGAADGSGDSDETSQGQSDDDGSPDSQSADGTKSSGTETSDGQTAENKTSNDAASNQKTTSDQQKPSDQDTSSDSTANDEPDESTEGNPDASTDEGESGGKQDNAKASDSKADQKTDSKDKSSESSKGSDSKQPAEKTNQSQSGTSESEDTADSQQDDQPADDQIQKKQTDDANAASSNETDNQAQIKTATQSADAAASLPFEQGERSPDIADFKQKLNDIGFGGILVTNYFGNYTEQQVTAFQQNYGLESTGTVNQETWDKIKSVYNSPFQMGERHPDIPEMKKKLNMLDYGGILVTNYFGSYTRKQVKNFQRDQGLEPNGIADDLTREKLNSKFTEGFQVGARHDGIIDFKQKLNHVGFDGILVTSYYGSYTKQQVKAFQQYYGLEATGRANLKTQEKLNAVYQNPLQQGNRHEDIPQLKKDMEQLGFGGILITTYFGNFSDKQLKRFQDYYGLVANGIADAPTQAKMDDLLDSPFQQGKRHEQLPAYKKKLNRLGYSGILVTNYFGNYTEKMVKDFQNGHNLRVNGILDEVTRSELDSAFATGFQQGARHDGMPALKRKLNRLGFGHILVTNYFGSYSEEQVKAFQNTYGLNATGKVNMATYNKIVKILNSPYQEGKRDPKIETIKIKLNQLGYSGIKVTDYFGSFTEKRLKQFQADHDLPVSGIADEKTLAKLNQNANTVKNKTYDLSFNDAVNIQTNSGAQTDKYRNETAYIHGDYVTIEKTASITGDGVRLRTAPEFADNKEAKVNSGTDVTYLKEVKGDSYDGSTTWYKIKYDDQTLYVHASLADQDSRTAEASTTVNIRKEANADSHKYDTVGKGTSVNIIDKGDTWYEISYDGDRWRNPTAEDTAHYLNPSNFASDEKQKFQFLDLRYYTDVPSNELDKLLDGKGVLDGKENIFRQAAKDAGINEVYLISHALLESGNGASDLAQGVTYKGETVYNFYGIGAYDGCAKDCGAKRAYNEGWFTIKDAIIGGAEFAKDKYIYSGQHTLYDMRWNPQAMDTSGAASHQYATDIGWASKQVGYYSQFYMTGDYPLRFEIPDYQ